MCASSLLAKMCHPSDYGVQGVREHDGAVDDTTDCHGNNDTPCSPLGGSTARDSEVVVPVTEGEATASRFAGEATLLRAHN